MLARKLGVTPEYLETGSELDAADMRELRLAEQELRLRLDRDGDITSFATCSRTPRRMPTWPRPTRARASCSASRPRRAATTPRRWAAHADDRLRARHPRGAAPTCTRRSAGPTRRAAHHARRSRSSSARSSSSPASTPRTSRPGSGTAPISATRSPTSASCSGRRPSWPRCSPTRATSADRYTRVRLYWSLGRISLEQAKPLAALDNFRRAVSLLEATEDTVHLAGRISRAPRPRSAPATISAERSTTSTRPSACSAFVPTPTTWR